MGTAPSIWTEVFYGFGSVAYGVKDNGFSFFLLLYYNQVLGLPEAWVGLGMIALVLDAVSDPIVGYASDNTHSRWGRRHPFMYAAAVPVAVSYYFLWTPPAGLSGGALFAYFLALAILIRTLITFYEIPSSALVAELTDHYDQRTSMLSYRYFFGGAQSGRLPTLRAGGVPDHGGGDPRLRRRHASTHPAPPEAATPAPPRGARHAR